MGVRSLGWEDPLEEGMGTHCSILAWKIPWTEDRVTYSQIGLKLEAQRRLQGLGCPVCMHVC